MSLSLIFSASNHLSPGTARINNPSVSEKADETTRSDESNAAANPSNKIIADIVKLYEESPAALIHKTKDEIYNGLMESYASFRGTKPFAMPSEDFCRKALSAIAIERASKIVEKSNGSQNEPNARIQSQSEPEAVPVTKNIEVLPPSIKKWTNNKVPFKFDASITPENKALILEAMEYIQSVSYLKFVEEDFGNNSGILFNSTPTLQNSGLMLNVDGSTIRDENLGGTSAIGMQIGPQEIYLGAFGIENSMTKNFLHITVHEIFHALGFKHEEEKVRGDLHIHGPLDRSSVMMSSLERPKKENLLQYSPLTELDENFSIAVLTQFKGDSIASLTDIMKLRRIYPPIGEENKILEFVFSWIEGLDEIDRNQKYNELINNAGTNRLLYLYDVIVNAMYVHKTEPEMFNMLSRHADILEEDISEKLSNKKRNIEQLLSRVGLTTQQYTAISQLQSELEWQISDEDSDDFEIYRARKRDYVDDFERKRVAAARLLPTP